jgi:hypothetical protein
MVTIEQVQEARRQIINVNLNNVNFEVYPTRSAMVIKAWARERGGGVAQQYGSNAFMKLNEKYTLYIGDRYSKDNMCKGAGMSVWDVAVPQQWLDQPANKKKWQAGEWAVWSYDGKNRTFGAPVWKSEIMRNVKKNILSVIKTRAR